MSPLHGVRSTWRDVAWRGVGACALRQGFVLGDGGRRGAAGRAARVAQRLVEALCRVGSGGHFAL